MFFNFGIRDDVNWYPCGLITLGNMHRSREGKGHINGGPLGGGLLEP